MVQNGLLVQNPNLNQNSSLRASFGAKPVPPATVYRFGRRQIGHIHNTGVADLTFPREIHDKLISDGRAKPHEAGFAAVVSYHFREPEDVPKVVELFRISYEHAKESAERRRQRTERRYPNDAQGQRSA